MGLDLCLIAAFQAIVSKTVYLEHSRWSVNDKKKAVSMKSTIQM